VKYQTHAIPFHRAIPDALELEFGPNDFLRVRPLRSFPKHITRDFFDRLKDVDETSEEGQEFAQQLVIDLLDLVVLEWSLEGPEGQIPMPRTPEALLALPDALSSGLFKFLIYYRGLNDAENPTTRS
jgi:hypothetical protein